MGYILKAIDPQEKLILLTHPHWIYLATGFFWSLFFIILGFFFDYYIDGLLHHHSFNFLIGLKNQYSFGLLTPISAVFSFIGLVTFWPYFSTYVSSEIGLTTERIIIKSGLILIKVDEVDLEDIRAEHVYHGLFGWLLKYGKIKLDCRFVKDVEILAIAEPYRFVKTSHNARLKHSRIQYDEDDFASNIKLIEHHQKQSSPPERFKRMKNSFKISFWKSARNKSQ